MPPDVSHGGTSYLTGLPRRHATQSGRAEARTLTEFDVTAQAAFETALSKHMAQERAHGEVDLRAQLDALCRAFSSSNRVIDPETGRARAILDLSRRRRAHWTACSCAASQRRSRAHPAAAKLPGVYRMIFGQPRQEDLGADLLDRVPRSELGRLMEELRIDLSPDSGA